MMFRLSHTSSPYLGEMLCYRSAVLEDDARVDVRTAGFTTTTPFLMSESSIRLLRAIALPACQPPFANMKVKNVTHMKSVFVKWDKGSFTPLVFYSAGSFDSSLFSSNCTSICLHSLPITVFSVAAWIVLSLLCSSILCGIVCIGFLETLPVGGNVTRTLHRVWCWQSVGCRCLH